MTEVTPEASTPAAFQLQERTALVNNHHQPEVMGPVKRPPAGPLGVEAEPTKRVKTDTNSFKHPCRSAAGQAMKSLSHLLQWKEEMPEPQPPFPVDSYRHVEVEKVTDCKLDEHAQNLQAILINANWQSEETGGITMEQFCRLHLSDSLMSNGIAFVWAEKDNMSQVMSHLETMGYVYVEIFSFILISNSRLEQFQPPKPVKTNMSILDFFQRKQPKEQAKAVVEKKDYFKVKAEDMPEADPIELFTNQPAEYFKKAKKNLLLMRKINKKEQLELRHQRTSDVYFVLYDQQTKKMDTKSSECVYRLIETLLPRANYQPGEPLKMMELWAEPGRTRPGWVSVSEMK